MSACSITKLGSGDDAATGVAAGAGEGAQAAEPVAGSAPESADGGVASEAAAGDGAAPAGAAPAPAAAAPAAPAAPAQNIGGGGEARRASDRGVSEKELVLGILATDEDTFGEFGFTYEGKRHEQVLKPFVDEINAGGGINGRKLAIRLERYSPLNADEMQSKCVAMAEDHKVFAAIAPAGFYGDAEVCMASKETPLLTANNSSADTNYRRERGWVRQTLMNKDRLVKNWVDWMIDTGQVTPETKHGLVYTDVPEDRQLVLDVLIPYMRSRGLQQPSVAALTLGSADTGTAESQAAVLKFKSDGVQLVWPVTNFLQWYLFLQQAEAANYKPRYTMSDFGLIASDATYFYPASQWADVRGITVLRTGEGPVDGLPVSPQFKECQHVYNAGGETIAQDPADPSQPDGLEVANMQHYCEHLALFADAARRAGVNPTRQGLLGAIGSTGAWAHRVSLTEALTFTPEKYDGADSFAVVQWKAGCTCNRQVEGFRRGRW